MTTLTVKLRPLAETDLTNIYRYTHHRWGRPQATAYIRDLHQAFLSLAEHPAVGRDRSDIKPELRSHRHSSHVIFYRTTPTGILIVRILHHSMDTERHL